MKALHRYWHLENDLGETVNCAGDPAYVEALAEHRCQILDFLLQTLYQSKDWALDAR